MQVLLFLSNLYRFRYQVFLNPRVFSGNVYCKMVTKMLKWLRSQYKNVRSDYENLSFYDDVYDVPVYDVEHETIIDTFPLTAGTYILED